MASSEAVASDGASLTSAGVVKAAVSPRTSTASVAGTETSSVATSLSGICTSDTATSDTSKTSMASVDISDDVESASAVVERAADSLAADAEIASKGSGKLGKRDEREHLNLVFIGHVDAGKSTFCGRILYDTGQAHGRTMALPAFLFPSSVGATTYPSPPWLLPLHVLVGCRQCQ